MADGAGHVKCAVYACRSCPLDQAPYPARSDGTAPARADRLPAHAGHHPQELRALRLPARGNAGLRAVRDPADQVRRRDRTAGLLRPVHRRTGEGRRGPARTGAALRPDRAAGPLRGRARTRTDVPVPPLPDPARLPRRTPAARPFPRVLPVRHRRDRQGRTERALRCRDPGGDPCRVQRPGHRRLHHPAEQPQADARLLRGAGRHRRRTAGAGAARSRQAGQARRRLRARDADRRRLRHVGRGRGPDPGLRCRAQHRSCRCAGAPGRIGAGQRHLQPGPRRTARGAGTGEGIGRARERVLPELLHRPWSGLLHRHRLRDPAGRVPADRLDLLRRPLRGPRQPLHQIEAARRGHLHRPDPPVLAAARSRPDRRQRREQRAGHGRPDGRGPAGRVAGYRPPPARGRHQYRSADGKPQAGQAVPVRLARGHPLRGAGGRGRTGAWRGDGEGPAARTAVRREARGTGQQPEGGAGTGTRTGGALP